MLVLIRKKGVEYLNTAYLDMIQGKNPGVTPVWYMRQAGRSQAEYRKIKEKYPNKTIWLYTGSLWEEIQHEEILHYLDVLVDGEFQVDKLDVGLKWKGSSNQRVIDVPSTLCEHRIVLHAE